MLTIKRMAQAFPGDGPRWSISIPATETPGVYDTIWSKSRYGKTVYCNDHDGHVERSRWRAIEYVLQCF